MAKRIKTTYAERVGTGQAFLDYCKESNNLVNGTKKKDLQKIFNCMFKPLCDGKSYVSCFGHVITALQKCGAITVELNCVYLVSETNKPKSKPARIKKKSKSANKRSNLSVDQYLLLSKLSQDSGALNSRGGDGPDTTPVPGRVDADRCPEDVDVASGAAIADQALTAEAPQWSDIKSDVVTHCSICNVTYGPKLINYKQHILGKKHILAELLFQVNKHRPYLMTDKMGIKITANAQEENNEYLIDVQAGESKLVTFIIENTSSNCSAWLVNCELLKRLPSFRLNDKANVTDSMAMFPIPPGGCYEVDLLISPKQVGFLHAPVVFRLQFDNDKKDDIFIIRFVRTRTQNDVIVSLRPKAPFKRPPIVSRRKDNVEVIPGKRLPRIDPHALERVVPLDFYHVPSFLRQAVNRGLEKNKGLSESGIIKLQKLRNELAEPLAIDNYFQHFSTLLHFEEIQTEVDIRRYDIHGATMTKRGALLALQVPGLAENRPSVLRGDRLYVQILDASGVPGKKEYQGFVHDVENTTVVLGFHTSLMDVFLPNMKFNVEFEFNRLPCKLEHRACSLAEKHNLGDALFPTSKTAATYMPSSTVMTSDRLYNVQLEKNNEQMTAVRHIVAGTSRPAPYLIFGPPGTGKTVTLVEAMKQVWKLDGKAHILACAPSNSSADLIAERLLGHIPKQQIMRLNAASRNWKTIPAKVQDISNYDKGRNEFYYPARANLMKYRIIVCTLVTAGRLASAKFPSKHFSHVFIDEAGNAMEPETIIAVAGLLDILGRGQLVMAGDPKQLGPIIRSPFATKYKLNISLLERLMNCEPYARNPDKVYDSRVITKLLQNYRSHPAILDQPNQMFYDNELIASANRELRECLCQWYSLPCMGFPVIFHGVIGDDMREERSPSFFNPTEAFVVLTYINDLLSGRCPGIKIKQSDIGVIAPYRKQVQKIQQMLRKKNLSGIKVGSVEEFQGQERKVIIVSTVRSKAEYLSMDIKFNLGFLRNEKRFNVALTRAMALLIVIGNPLMLSLDETWKRFLVYCRDHRACHGMLVEPPEELMTDILERFAAIKLNSANLQASAEEIAKNNEQTLAQNI